LLRKFFIAGLLEGCLLYFENIERSFYVGMIVPRWRQKVNICPGNLLEFY
jgi:hypothetical protein